MAIAAIVVAAGLPSFGGLVERQRSQTALHLLGTHFAMARIAAVTYNTPVSVCPSNGDGYCRTDSDWSHGWLMYRNPDRAKQPTGPGDVLRQETPSLNPSLRFVSTAGRQQIHFLPDGRSAGSNLTVTLCRDDVALGQVVVNNAGRVRTASGGDSGYCANRS